MILGQMDLIARSVILLMTFGSYLEAANPDPYEHLFDDFYRNSKEGRIKNEVGFPNRRRTQLYSRNTGRFIQVTPKGKVVARGVDGNVYADLEILTVSFGKVHIKGLAASLYVCFDKRKRLIAKRRPTKGCVFREQHGEDAYTMYESEEINGKFLAFSRKGIHRYKAESKIGTKAVQFVERPRSQFIGKHLRYYTSGGKKERIGSWMFHLHKKMAEKKGRWRHLYRENNSALNALHGRKSSRKHRKNKHKKKKHTSKSKEKTDEKQEEETKDDNPRFPPKKRLGNEGKE